MIDITTCFVTLPYKEPIPVRGKILHENHFLKVTILDNDYYLSVLPGFHNATLEEIDFKIKRIFSHYAFNFDHIDFSKKYFNILATDDYLNTIHNEILFNIELLLLSLIKKRQPELLKEIKYNQNELYRSAQGAEAYSQSECLKIKITPLSVEKTISLINELHRLNEDMIFRLDGNRCFELSDFIQFESMLEKHIPPKAFLNIDYIEEPFKNYSDTFLVQKRSKLKLAMDESFSSLYEISAEKFPQDTPVVIKPSLFGISFIYNWMQTHPKIRIIISSSFEHPSVKIGLDFLASQRPSEYHGLENFLQIPN